MHQRSLIDGQFTRLIYMEKSDDPTAAEIAMTAISRHRWFVSQ